MSGRGRSLAVTAFRSEPVSKWWGLWVGWRKFPIIWWWWWWRWCSAPPIDGDNSVALMRPTRSVPEAAVSMVQFSSSDSLDRCGTQQLAVPPKTAHPYIAGIAHRILLGKLSCCRWSNSWCVASTLSTREDLVTVKGSDRIIISLIHEANDAQQAGDHNIPVRRGRADGKFSVASVNWYVRNRWMVMVRINGKGYGGDL